MLLRLKLSRAVDEARFHLVYRIVIDQVIPAIGGEVIVVNGRCRGSRATLESLDTDNFCAKVRITSEGPDKGTVLNKVEYEDICKAVPEDDT